MPNVSFDVFFDKDFINITATRGITAPKAKPEWKVRTAPKLPPKEVPVDDSNRTPRPPPRQKLTSTRQSLKPKQQPQDNQGKVTEVSDASSQTISNAVASAGSYAGGAVSAVGNGINGVGEGISRSIKRYGDGVKDYGNGIMDWTSASTTRAQTASNPLGLSGGKGQGKTTVTSPRIYQAPAKSNASRTLMTTSKTAPQKKIQSGTPKKALPAPSTKAAAAPVKKSNTSTAAPVKKSASVPNPGAMRKAGTTTTATKSPNAPKPAAVAKRATPVKASTASAPKTSTRAKVGGDPTAAANPLGLS